MCVPCEDIKIKKKLLNRGVSFFVCFGGGDGDGYKVFAGKMSQSN